MTKTLGHIGALLGVLFLLSIMDTVVSGYLEPEQLYRAFPGQVLFVAGKLEQPIPASADLGCTADSPALRVTFISSKGRMWRGKLLIPQTLEPGRYRFQVHLKWEAAPAAAPVSTLLVFRDAAAYRNSFYSVFERYFGIRPWWITLCVFPFMLVALGGSYWLTSKQEAHLNRKGFASIFKVTRNKETCEVSFGLGGKDGLEVGDRVRLWSREPRFIGEGRVVRVLDQCAVAEVDRSIPVKPDFLVSKKQ